MDLIKCPQCGERYSSSYSRCPFCEEDGGDPRKFKRSNRRTVDRHSGQSARGGLIAVLVLVLALLGWYLFGSDYYHSRVTNDSETHEDTEAVAPAEDSVPASAPDHEDAAQPAEGTQTDAPEETAEETAAPGENVDVSGAELNRSDFTLSIKGEKYTIKLSGTEATPIWSIDNPNIATITGNGTVTAVANGDTTVHCKVGSRDLTCTVRVRGTGSTAEPADAPMIAEPVTPVAPPQPVASGTNTETSADESGVKLNHSDVTITPGEKFTMKVIGTESTPQWDVDNPNVAVITKKGTVTGVGSGTTTVHCTVDSYDLICIVRVN